MHVAADTNLKDTFFVQCSDCGEVEFLSYDVEYDTSIMDVTADLHDGTMLDRHVVTDDESPTFSLTDSLQPLYIQYNCLKRARSHVLVTIKAQGYRDIKWAFEKDCDPEIHGNPNEDSSDDIDWDAVKQKPGEAMNSAFLVMGFLAAIYVCTLILHAVVKSRKNRERRRKDRPSPKQGSNSRASDDMERGQLQKNKILILYLIIKKNNFGCPIWTKISCKIQK